ncbi:hypothetical protein EDD94_7600 [Streptomyces sp. PanSC9]|nr:hypothetical protein EDD94_7600 [Streptomyces sp. PanSC9]
MIECRPLARIYGEDDEDAVWHAAIDLFLLNIGNAYDALACLLGGRNSFGFQPLAEDRGLPHDASDGLRAEFDAWSGPPHRAPRAGPRTPRRVVRLSPRTLYAGRWEGEGRMASAGYPSAAHHQCRMLTARAMTRREVSRAETLSTLISSFARLESGIVSVGLNAVELVKETYR